MNDNKNYIINIGEWKPLSDIMDSDYEVTEKYNIHVNLIRNGNALGLTKRLMNHPILPDRGSEYNSFDNIIIEPDTGDYIYLRALVEPISIEISVVE